MPTGGGRSRRILVRQAPIIIPMKRIALLLLLAGAVALGLLSAPAQAHHSRAQFQLDKLTPMTATITRVRWSNPHVFYAGTVVNDQGVKEEWVFEGHSISGLVRQGWSEDLVKV